MTHEKGQTDIVHTAGEKSIAEELEHRLQDGIIIFHEDARTENMQGAIVRARLYKDKDGKLKVYWQEETYHGLAKVNDANKDIDIEEYCPKLTLEELYRVRDFARSRISYEENETRRRIEELQQNLARLVQEQNEKIELADAFLSIIGEQK